MTFLQITFLSSWELAIVDLLGQTSLVLLQKEIVTTKSSCRSSEKFLLKGVRSKHVCIVGLYLQLIVNVR